MKALFLVDWPLLHLLHPSVYFTLAEVCLPPASSLAGLIELLGTIARLTALAAQPDTTASRTLLPLSIKLLYLALTARCLLSCRLVR